jgi:serine/threonine-protein kinase
MLTRAVPARVVAQIDDSVKLLAKKAPDLDDDNDDDAPVRDATARLGASLKDAAVDLSELTVNESQNDQEIVSLVDPDPVRFLQGQLHELWKQAIAALQAQARPGPPNQPRPGAGAHLPVGPYRVVVIASLRGRSAGQVAIQGMANKQVEISTPALRTAGSSSKPILAIWVYRDNSLVLTHLDFQGTQRYVLWHAPRAHQLKFDDPDELSNELETLGMELPDQLDTALSRRFRPSGG